MAISLGVKRNSDGFSSISRGSPLADLDFGDFRKWAVFMEDFLAYDIGQAAGNPWTHTSTNDTDTIVGPTGFLKMSITSGDNNLGQMQLTETPFALTADKHFFFEADGVKVTATMADMEVFVGMASEQTGTAFFASDGLSITADDVLGFSVFDGADTADAVQSENDTQSIAQDVLTWASGTAYKFTIHYDGSLVHYYIDDVLKATLSGNQPTSALTPTLYIKAGSIQAPVLDCDYILVAVER